jgi:Replication initiation factor
MSIQGDPTPLASAEEASATPRPTNRGVTSTERVDRVSEALIDWVEWTEHEAGASAVCARLSDDWVDGGHGGLGYQRSRVSEGIVVLYDGQSGMGVHVRIPGAACRGLEARGTVPDWEAFLATLRVEERSITRLDVALDNRTGSISVDRCYQEIKAGHLVRRLRTASAPEFLDVDGETESRTLYFGSPTSDLRVRIYDKALQEDVAGPWTRVEIQARDERARALADVLTIGDAEQRAALFGGLVLHYLDFREPTRDGNRSRWATAPWWSEFVLDGVKRKLCLAPKPLPSADEAIAALAQQYGPTMAAIVEVVGFGPLFDAIEASRSRWKPRHDRMRAQWRAEL